jgi:hypothetical protein
MNRRKLYSTIVALLAGPFIFLICAAQSTAPVVQRDQAAVQVLTTSLDTMGGQRLWSTITATRVTGTTTVQSSPAIQKFDWADDWSSPSLYRTRKLPQSETNDLTRQEQKSSSVSGQGSPISATHIPSDFIEGIVTYAPAAAIFRVLTDQSYDLHVTHISGQTAGSDCVLVTNVTRRRPVGIWCFTSNHLPSQFMEATAPILPYPQGSSKRITYNSFAQQSGILMPSAVTVTYPFGEILDITVTHTEINPKLARTLLGDSVQ